MNKNYHKAYNRQCYELHKKEIEHNATKYYIAIGRAKKQELRRIRPGKIDKAIFKNVTWENCMNGEKFDNRNN